MINNNYKIISTIFILSIALMACDNQAKKEEAKKFEEKKEKLEEKLSDIQDDIDDKIKDLGDKSEDMAEDAKTQIETTVSRLKTERSKVSKLIQDVRASSVDTFDKIEEETNEAYQDVSQNVEKWSADAKEWFEKQKEKMEG